MQQELVWRKGDERCERSYRETPQIVPTEKMALAEAPETDRTPMIDFRDGLAFSQSGSGGAASPNRRETANTKINERYLIGQATQNPFMPNNNYVNDIEVQMNFLTPSKG
jgi:hypothetical protein